MARIFIISDLHLSHKNEAIRRGFKTVEAHDNYIISSWNSVVNKKDIVWILGDITMEKSSPYYLLDKLNGTKKVVLGNHDKPQHVTELLKYVTQVGGVVMYKGLLLTHFPIHESELKRCHKNIHGHLHKRILENKKYANVSCEIVNYIPQLITKYMDYGN